MQILKHRIYRKQQQKKKKKKKKKKKTSFVYSIEKATIILQKVATLVSKGISFVFISSWNFNI